MKKLLGLSAVLVAIAMSAGSASADHRNSGSNTGASARVPDSSVPDPRSPDLSGPDEEVVTGRVVELDRDRGTLTLETSRGLALQGSPEALESVSIGDVVKVRVAFIDQPTEPTRPIRIPVR